MQSIYNIAEICAQKGMREVILSPGSRCAPLTISFVRHPDIETKTISDERSAAFIAIGISQQTKNVTGLVCTSGSAAYNYAPAIAEAYYQQIPLLILTADRPPEWIDQLDGQTIRQENIYGSHVKKTYSLPVDTSHADAQWQIERIISEAINLSKEFPCGPVHINIPLREPFYPESPIVFNKNIKAIEKIDSEKILTESSWNILLKELTNSFKILIIAGQSDYNEELSTAINNLSTTHKIPVVADIISNLHDDNIIRHHDTILSQKDVTVVEGLKPDLIITFGKSVISKSLKQFIRKSKNIKHWHIQETGYVADTYQTLSKIINTTPQYFFKTLDSKLNQNSSTNTYYNTWRDQEEKAQKNIQDFFESENTFTEFYAFDKIFKSIPDNSILHLANSMPVRYANFLGLNKTNIEVFANRGTSGIDGVISTALGAALSTDKIVTVITGDMTFFYDRNALWNNYIPSNLKIIILNNHGGGIFRIIDGPNRQPELDEYFETKQKLIAENTAKDYHLKYTICKNTSELDKSLSDFFKGNHAAILEIETDSKTNTTEFQKFKKGIN